MTGTTSTLAFASSCVDGSSICGIVNRVPRKRTFNFKTLSASDIEKTGSVRHFKGMRVALLVDESDSASASKAFVSHVYMGIPFINELEGQYSTFRSTLVLSMVRSLYVSEWGCSRSMTQQGWRKA